MTILFVGNAGLGSVQMRGRDVAARIGADFSDWSKLPSGPLDTVVVVKYFTPQIRELRRRCRVLIADPLDGWSSTKPNADPVDFWKWWQRETQCDLMLGCSPSAVATMRAAGCNVVVAPHHADERIGTDWFDKSGPVVYAGGERFLGGERPKIESACRDLGREFVCRFDRDCWQVLKGASLSLSPRFGVERTALNTLAKPALKVANASRGGIPSLCTSDPAISSLCEFAVCTGKNWIDEISNGLKHSASKYKWTINTHCETINELCRR